MKQPMGINPLRLLLQLCKKITRATSCIIKKLSMLISPPHQQSFIEWHISLGKITYNMLQQSASQVNPATIFRDLKLRLQQHTGGWNKKILPVWRD